MSTKFAVATFRVKYIRPHITADRCCCRHPLLGNGKQLENAAAVTAERFNVEDNNKLNASQEKHQRTAADRNFNFVCITFICI